MLGICSFAIFPREPLIWMFRGLLAEWFNVSPLMVFGAVWIYPFDMSFWVELMLSVWLYFVVCALAGRALLCRKEGKYTVDDKRGAVVAIFWAPAMIIMWFAMEFGWFLYRYWSL